MAETASLGGYRLELLDNGFVRVESPAELVSLVQATGLRSGPSVPAAVRRAAQEMALR